ncbi:UNVERIFIED_CONTAM: hypothetical protein RKD43_006148 [Streptomyces graminofaciens]
MSFHSSAGRTRGAGAVEDDKAVLLSGNGDAGDGGRLDAQAGEFLEAGGDGVRERLPPDLRVGLPGAVLAGDPVGRPADGE